MFIMVDGIDGSGKSTIVESWKKYLLAEGKTIFDLKDYSKTVNRYPDYDEVKSCDVIFSHEPSNIGIGRVVREEMIRNNTDYWPYTIAEAYALDRMINYKKMIVPALADGKLVISDRGVCTSLCYQHVSDPELSFKDLAEIPGNGYTLKHSPEHLIFVTVNPDIAIKRLQSRQKNDDAIFEKFEFLKKADAVYRSEEYQKIFTERGTKVGYLSANEELDIMVANGLELLKELLSSSNTKEYAHFRR